MVYAVQQRYCTEVIKWLKEHHFDLNGFSFADYFRIPYLFYHLWSQRYQVFFYKIIITAGNLLTNQVCYTFCLHYYISMLKSILKLCCAYRTGLTPYYYINSCIVDLKGGNFWLFTWFDYFRAIALYSILYTHDKRIS